MNPLVDLLLLCGISRATKNGDVMWPVCKTTLDGAEVPWCAEVAWNLPGTRYPCSRGPQYCHAEGQRHSGTCLVSRYYITY